MSPVRSNTVRPAHAAIDDGRMSVSSPRPARVNTAVTAWNEHQVEAMMDLAGDLGVALQLDPEVTPRDDGDASPLSIASCAPAKVGVLVSAPASMPAPKPLSSWSQLERSLASPRAVPATTADRAMHVRPSAMHARSVSPLLLLALVLLVGLALASPYEHGMQPEDMGPDSVYSPYVGRAYPDQVFFGDTHFHTDRSFDAGLVGTRLGVDEAFRFARGEQVISNTGQPVQLVRPLDFLVITDHAEFDGLASMLRTSDPRLLATEWGRWVHERFNAGAEGRAEEIGADLWARSPAELLEKLVREPERRATPEQRTVGRHRRGSKSAA